VVHIVRQVAITFNSHGRNEDNIEEDERESGGITAADLLQLPTTAEIQACPLLGFFQTMRVLHCVLNPSIALPPALLQLHKFDCFQAMNDLRQAGRDLDRLQSKAPAGTCLPSDIVELQMAFFLSSNNQLMAEKSLRRWRKELLCSEDCPQSNEAGIRSGRAGYYRLLSQYVYYCNRTSVDSFIAADSTLHEDEEKKRKEMIEARDFLQAVSQWILNAELSSSAAVLLSALLHHLDIIPAASLCSFVWDLIEKSPSLDGLGSGKGDGCSVWMLWRVAAQLVGPIGDPIRDDQEPISPSSELYSLFIGVPPSHDQQLQNDPTQIAASSSAAGSDGQEVSRLFRQERSWWQNKVFSIANLGEFVEGILCFEVESLMNELQEMDRDDCLKSFDMLCGDFSTSQHDSSCNASPSADGWLYRNEKAFFAIFHEQLHFRVHSAGSETERAGSDSDSDREGTHNGPTSQFDHCSPAPSSSSNDNAMRYACHLARSLLFPNGLLPASSSVVICPCCNRDHSEVASVAGLNGSGGFDGFAVHEVFGDYFNSRKYLKEEDSKVKEHRKELHRLKQRQHYRLLGSRALEVLTSQLLMCCHLLSQDCLFVVRGVQLLLQHAMPITEADPSTLSSSSSVDVSVVARRCLRYLDCSGVHIVRAARLAFSLALREAPVSHCPTADPFIPLQIDESSRYDKQYRASYGSYVPI